MVGTNIFMPIHTFTTSTGILHVIQIITNIKGVKLVAKGKILILSNSNYPEKERNMFPIKEG
jgi:hypothetical protein